MDALFAKKVPKKREKRAFFTLFCLNFFPWTQFQKTLTKPEPQIRLFTVYIEFKASAFRHKINETDIRHAFMNPCYDGPIEDADNIKNRFIRLGFDTNGNLLEIMYNEYADHVCIFHVMKCRSIFFGLLEV